MDARRRHLCAKVTVSNCHRRRRPWSRLARLVWTSRSTCSRCRADGAGHRRTATINQIRAFLIEQGIAVRAGARALRKSLFAILENRKDEISPRMAKLIRGLYEDWCCLDERIETVTAEVEELSRIEPSANV